jgi:hypothetical protein
VDCAIHVYVVSQSIYAFIAYNHFVENTQNFDGMILQKFKTFKVKHHVRKYLILKIFHQNGNITIYNLSILNKNVELG